MRNGRRVTNFKLIAVALGLLLANAVPAWSKPLKVFILAGQSNMQGHANISTFDYMANDPKTATILKEMRGSDGKPRVCRRVWISSIGCAGDDTTEQKGKLTAGFGASPAEIGPEFTFGIYLEKLLAEPILIIKTSWGGKDLHTDFRPPSAGPFVWSDFELNARKNRGDDMEKDKADKIKATGAYYRLMIEHVRNVLKDIKRVMPEYDPSQGYEIAGFVWFQGFNDLVSTWTYDKYNQPGGYDMYSTLLADFIRDVRRDLNAPKMPFVIGVMGLSGAKPPQNEAYFHKAQAAPAALPEFKGTVVAVETAPFWDSDLSETRERVQALWPRADAALAEEIKKHLDEIRDGEAFKDKFIADNLPPEIAKRMSGVSNYSFHYLGAAKIMAPIGKAFAEAMVTLQQSRRQEGQ
jgi:alpha-galactosidase